MIRIELTDKDFNIEWYSGSGAGGQHRNKHQNCCRITHKESNITSIGTSNRSREANKKEAYDAMKIRLKEWYQKNVTSKIPERSDEIIRIYHAERNEVKDLSSGIKQSYKNVVIDKDISKMIESRKMSGV